MRRHRDDRGVTTVGFAVVFASILLLVMLAVQAGLYWHVRQRADAAAARAAAAAARVDGSSANGHAAADAFLSGAPIDDASVRVSRGGTSATASVSGTAPSLVPIVAWAVYAEATVPLERFVPEPERG